MILVKKFDPLYKLDSRDSKRIWNIRVDDGGGIGVITIEHGLMDGARQEKVEEVHEGKNLGRANETCPVGQAIAEAQSKWNKQLDKGYTTDQNCKSVSILPMLAHDYFKQKKKLKWPCYIQPKLDGCRTLAIKSGTNYELRSRKNKLFDMVPHINEQLLKIGADKELILDGELYVHGMDFQKIISIIKRDDLHTDYQQMELHIYDCFFVGTPIKYEARYKTLEKLSHYFPAKIKFVETYKINNEKELRKYYEKFIGDGYEGAILRNSHGEYEMDSRSYNLLKYKEFVTEEFEIVDVEVSDREPVHQCTIMCVTAEGNVFGAKPDGTEEYRAKLYYDRDKIIGKMGTVKYFEMTTSDKPLPRFPIFQSVRNYE